MEGVGLGVGTRRGRAGAGMQSGRAGGQGVLISDNQQPVFSPKPTALGSLPKQCLTYLATMRVSA